MSSTPNPPSPEQLALLAQVVREVTRARRMSTEDAEDFAQSVQVRLVERGYDVFHRFTGRSSLKTYLTVVVRNLLLDWRNSMYGRWRPSVIASRLGADAVELERLINRDKHTPDEAIAVVRMRSSASKRDLQHLVEGLPRHVPRRTVFTDDFADVPSIDFDDPLRALEAENNRACVRRSLAAALRQLPSDDRRLVILRYQHNRSVQALAQLLEVDPKTLYRRFQRVLRLLRRALLAQGITGSTMLEPM